MKHDGISIRTSRACAVASALCALSFAWDAGAQSSADSAAAQGLFDQAKGLMDAGKAAEACPKFEESQRLDPGSGTLLNLAKCYEQTNRVASAWNKYLEAAVAARAAGNPEREATARELAAVLAPRVSKLVIEVPPEAKVEGLEVQRDGAAVGAAQWGVPIPADSGKHTLVAKAPGRKAWNAEFVIEGEGTSSKLAVPVLEVAEKGSSGAAGASDQGGGLGSQKVVALVAGGVGVVGLGIGTIFGLKSKSSHDEAATYCSGATCTDPRGVTAGNDAYAAGTVATVGLIVGGVGLAAGAVLWFTAPSGGARPEMGAGAGARPRGARAERAHLGAPSPGLRTEVGIGIGGFQVKGIW